MKKIISIEEFTTLSDEQIQKILRGLEETELALALKGTSSEVLDKVFANMSERAVKLIQNDIDNLTDKSDIDIESAINSILEKANTILTKEITKIALASDHAGIHLKNFVKEYLKDYQIIDFGTHSTDSMDYPDSGFPAATAVANGEADRGILICGSGIGMSIVANKVKGIRAALCHCTDFVKLTRQHNNANVLVLPGRFISEYLAKDMIDIFLSTPFDGGRHLNRINKISDYENKNN